MTISETLLSEFDKEMALTRKMLAAMPFWASVVIHGQGKKPSEAASKTELLETMDRNVALGRKAIAEASGWLFFEPAVMSHMIHHRGQLSVYLRLLDVAGPGMYGPSADERQG